MSDDAAATLESPLLEEAAAPLSGDGSAGTDISYDDDFLALKDEVDQLSSANPEGVDYDRIVERCRRILGSKSKDLRVSTYMALALSRTSGYEGIMDGIRVQNTLVERYWEALFPPLRRMRARQNAFQFMAERLTDALTGLKPKVEDRPFIEESLNAVKSLQAFTMDVMGDEAPVLSGLSRALEDALRKSPKDPKGAQGDPQMPADQPTAPAAATSQPSTDGVDGGAAAGAATPLGDEVKTLSGALDRVLALAGFLHEQAPTDPASFRIARSVQWDPIDTEPSNQAGRTLFQDPPPHRITYFNTLFDGKDWKTLLEETENTFREAPYHFWLDLQRFIVAALEGLGTGYERARDAVVLETALLMRRVPTLSQLTFMGGAPFADAKTKFWLDDTVATILAGDSGDGTAATDAELSGHFDEAKKLAAAGKLSAALNLLQEGLRHDGARRSRFHRRLQMASLCMQADKPAVARPILEQLESDVDTFELEEWEPGLAMEVWNQLHTCYEMLARNDEKDQDSIQRDIKRVFDRICRLDATRALER